ncbi:MAG: prenyltransferase, partial [Gammaproteobacteria bacterium]|nr:prenyltransferase [Gammaproteobacteria bacterium]
MSKVDLTPRPLGEKTYFLRALRPFSLIVAFSSCLLGILLATVDGHWHPALAPLLLVSGILLQMAVNLINDDADTQQSRYSLADRARLRRNSRLGRGLLLLLTVIGLYLVSLRGVPLLVVEGVGLIGAWGYTASPIHYKNRGLGVVLVFFLMGVMMVGGCYYTLSGEYSWRILLLSLPFSGLASLLLLANELRDFEEDQEQGIATLTVRIGFRHASLLFFMLLSAIYLSLLPLYWQGWIASPLLLIVTLPLLLPLLSAVEKQSPNRQRLPQLTGRLYAGYSLAFISS